jgi:hypothetical protein
MILVASHDWRGVQKALRVLEANGFWQLPKRREVYGERWQPR